MRCEQQLRHWGWKEGGRGGEVGGVSHAIGLHPKVSLSFPSQDSDLREEP